MCGMDADSSDARSNLGVSFRRVALAVLLLLVVRGAYAGVYEFVSGGNWLAAVGVVVLASILLLWLFYRYVESRSAA